MNNMGLFFPDPGVYEELKCCVCNENMDVKRDQYGPTSWAGSMACLNRKHDAFKCSHIEEQWHIQAIALFKEAEKTASKSISDIIVDEAKRVVSTRTITKDI